MLLPKCLPTVCLAPLTQVIQLFSKFEWKKASCFTVHYGPLFSVFSLYNECMVLQQHSQASTLCFALQILAALEFPLVAGTQWLPGRAKITQVLCDAHHSHNHCTELHEIVESHGFHVGIFRIPDTCGHWNFTSEWGQTEENNEFHQNGGELCWQRRQPTKKKIKNKIAVLWSTV